MVEPALPRARITSAARLVLRVENPITVGIDERNQLAMLDRIRANRRVLVFREMYSRAVERRSDDPEVVVILSATSHRVGQQQHQRAVREPPYQPTRCDSRLDPKVCLHDRGQTASSEPCRADGARERMLSQPGIWPIRRRDSPRHGPSPTRSTAFPGAWPAAMIAATAQWSDPASEPGSQLKARCPRYGNRTNTATVPPTLLDGDHRDTPTGTTSIANYGRSDRAGRNAARQRWLTSCLCFAVNARRLQATRHSIEQPTWSLR